MSNNFIFFDLEGPLSPQDNAYDLMKLIPDGGRIFEVISRYDDLLTLEEKPDYEPGDTLALIVPFLVRHNITEANIIALANKATLVSGAPELISALKSKSWSVFCITTTYEQYARRVAQRVGIATDNVACTTFPLDKLHQALGKHETQLLEQAEKDILSMPPGDDAQIKQRLDHLYWQELPATNLGTIIKQVKPVGGRRKVAALKKFTDKYPQPLSQCIVVGDSITDFRMFQAVEEAKGLAIAFNANEYALPYATLGLASTHLSDLLPVLEVWQNGNRSDVQKFVRQKERGNAGDRNNFHWLSGRKNIDDIIKLHKRIRRLVREEAGKLG